MGMPSFSECEGFVGKHIRTFCPLGYVDNSVLHCAHFVSHVLGLKTTTHCGALVAGQSANPSAACVRVNELFGKCALVGTWETMPSSVICGLAFLTNPTNVNLSKKTMANANKKHVGFFWRSQALVFHYDNGADSVVSQSVATFRQHYASPDNGLFYATIVV